MRQARPPPAAGESARGASPSKTVLYLSYGLGPHVDETRYSLLSAFALAPAGGDLRYVVYTDHPDLFADLPVEVRVIEPWELEAWMGGLDYVHRRKSAVMADALARFPGSVAFVDCDTYYLRSPRVIFDRIAPEKACMHLQEARLLESGTAVDRAISLLVTEHVFSDVDGRPYDISPDAMMWNSGVIGLDGRDARLMHEVLHLIDQMWIAMKRLKVEARCDCHVHHIEQFATGIVLQSILLKETNDVVFHYWLRSLRDPFRACLPELLKYYRGISDAEDARLRSARPKGSASQQAKQRLRRLGRLIGLRVPGLRASA